MDFTWTSEQREIRATIERFAREKLNETIIENDRASRFPRSAWNQCGAVGLFGLPVPEEYGGINADILTTLYAMEGLGYHCKDNGLIFAINAQLWSSIIPLLHFGTEEQKKKFVPRLVSGEIIGGHAITEPNSGSDAFSLRTTATKDEDSYILNGNKVFITNAPVADILIVFARTGQSQGFMGTSAFLVERGTPGFDANRQIELMGLRTCPVGEISFQQCRIPADNLLGREGGGAAIFNAEMEWERSCLFACHVGHMQRELEDCISYATLREQFGEPIGRKQAISHTIAQMQMRIELSRLILYKLAWLKREGLPTSIEGAAAKLFVSESYVQTMLEAVRIRGAYGYSTEYETERGLRDAIASTIYSGTSEIQKNSIASLLGLSS